MTPLQALQKYFGYSNFRHQQEAIIYHVLKGGDTMALMPTGGGKSLCYQLPAVLFSGLTIVISPLIALMKDQVDALNVNGIPAAYINSSQSPAEQQQIFARLQGNQVKLLYLAPERLFSPGSNLISFLKGLQVSLVAIDEAHCISHWGHDFRPEYLMLAGLKIEFPKTPVIALTATADQLTQQDIKDKLGLHNPAVFLSSFNRENITYRVVPKKNSYDKLLSFLNERPDESGIIYCLSRNATVDLAGDLKKQGFKAGAYHAGLDNETKARNQEAFLRDEIKIIVATIAFGMGINKSNVRYVVHMDLPKNIEGYYQETGRAGRDGLPSAALLFFSPGDAFKLQGFAKVEGNEEQSRIMLKKLDDMVKYCQLQTCRRQYLMHYFNEQFPDYCGSCDVCLTEFKRFDGTIIAQKALSAVARLQERFGSGYVIDFLRGSQSEKIREEHRQLKTYGIGADVSKADWQRYLRELTALGYLQTTEDQYPILKLTPASEAVLRGKTRVQLTEQEAEEQQETQTLPYEAELLQQLKATRWTIAEQENVPAYIILSDAALLEMAAYLPQTADELQQISGFGEVKLERYAHRFLPVITAYAARHQLTSLIRHKAAKRERKSKTSRTSHTNTTRLESFNLFRAGKSIAEIASERKLSAVTIESHLCSFVQSGEMAVSELVPPHKMPAIENAVQSYGAERLAPLKEVLGDEYSYSEIKAVVSWLNRTE